MYAVLDDASVAHRVVEVPRVEASRCERHLGGAHAGPIGLRLAGHRPDRADHAVTGVGIGHREGQVVTIRIGPGQRDLCRRRRHSDRDVGCRGRGVAPRHVSGGRRRAVTRSEGERPTAALCLNRDERRARGRSIRLWLAGHRTRGADRGAVPRVGHGECDRIPVGIDCPERDLGSRCAGHDLRNDRVRRRVDDDHGRRCRCTQAIADLELERTRRTRRRHRHRRRTHRRPISLRRAHRRPDRPHRHTRRRAVERERQTITLGIHTTHVTGHQKPAAPPDHQPPRAFRSSRSRTPTSTCPGHR